MPSISSFPPLARADARLLILGSMPGEASLVAGRYYAHPQNTFWPILAELYGFPADAPYHQRVAALKRAGIAVWDVLQSCRRKGSLDSGIAPESEVANDFTAFFATHPRIRKVCFNGSKAEQAFRRHVLPTLDARQLTFCRLPSTSPAHATLDRKAKLAAWHSALAEGSFVPGVPDR